MEKFIKQNWFISIVVLILVVLFIYYLPKTKKVSIDNQQYCSVMAEQYFTKKYTNLNSENSRTYTNHFNSKLNKCFILISKFDIDSGIEIIDLYDTLENKHYGAFIGQRFCDNECGGDSGVIWSDGNDSVSPTDGAESYKEFLEKIKPFMNN